MLEIQGGNSSGLYSQEADVLVGGGTLQPGRPMGLSVGGQCSAEKLVLGDDSGLGSQGYCMDTYTGLRTVRKKQVCD